MAASIINKLIYNNGSGSSGWTSSPIDTDGADFLFIAVVSYSAHLATDISDSEGNTFTHSSVYHVSGSGYISFHWTYAPNTYSGHQFVWAVRSCYPNIHVYALAGMLQDAAVYDIGNANTTSTTVTPSIVPAAAHEVLISVYGTQSASVPTVSAPFNTVDQYILYVGGTSYGTGMAIILDYNSTASTSATWTTGLTIQSAGIIAFKPAVTSDGLENVRRSVRAHRLASLRIPPIPDGVIN